MYSFEKMTEQHACTIINWKYPPPYDFYNGQGTEDELEELLHRGYMTVTNQQGELVGYFCTGKAGTVPAGHTIGGYPDGWFDIGIGMAPMLTGKGWGTIFFKEVLDFIEQQNSVRPKRLTVASFNKRAIRLYQKFGFVEQKRFLAGANEFVIMTGA
ncbi:GNAT family N-acetyltransferase [Peribacillus sp. SCS-155]|uniref:GNAT family N-acetyltransferase n=1 Tax=Peribacillus sedimenti TaxID=3115297 RepID=UPI0039060900